MTQNHATTDLSNTPLFDAVRAYLIDSAKYALPDSNAVNDMGEKWTERHESIIVRLTLNLIRQLETGKNPILGNTETPDASSDPVRINFEAPKGQNTIIANAVDENGKTLASLPAIVVPGTQQSTMNNQDVRYALFWKLLHKLDSEVSLAILDNTTLKFTHETDLRDRPAATGNGPEHRRPVHADPDHPSDHPERLRSAPGAEKAPRTARRESG